MGRFQLEVFIFITHFSTVIPLTSCVYFPVGLSSFTRYFQEVLQFLLSPGLGREHVKEEHEMKTMEETMSIKHLENNHRNINTLEEIDILLQIPNQWCHRRTKWPNVQTSHLISDLNCKINSNKSNFETQRLK
jgi:hypothetical protein